MRDLEDVMRAALDADEGTIRERIDMDAVLRGTTGRVVRRRRVRLAATTAVVVGVLALGSGVAWGAMYLGASPVPPAVTSTPTPGASAAAPSATATLASVDVDTLGTLPQADAGVLARATTGWALLEYAGPARSDTDGTLRADRMVLADPADGVLYHVLDLERTDLADYRLRHVTWAPGDTTATVLASTSTAAGTTIVEGTVDLLSGKLTVDGSLALGTDWETEGVRHDGAIVAASPTSPTSQIVVGTAGTGNALASVDMQSYGEVDPTGHLLLTMGANLTAYQVVDLDTGKLTRFEWGSGRSCGILRWVDGTHVLASCSRSVTTYPNGFDGPTDADGASLMQVDLTTGTASIVVTPASGDVWPETLSALDGGQVLVGGWRLPSAGEVAAWGRGDSAAVEDFCTSHVYVGTWTDNSYTEVKVAGGWPLDVLGGAGHFGYIATDAAGCEATSAIGRLEVYDAATGTTTTLVKPTGMGDEGGWILLTAL